MPQNLVTERSCFVTRESRVCASLANERGARVQVWLELIKIEWEKPVLKYTYLREGYGGPRDVSSLSLIYSTYLANSSSFAFFASSAASTGGKVGEKGTGDFGPFFFRARRRLCSLASRNRSEAFSPSGPA